MRVAQIFEDKAHWIFTTDETLEEVQSRFSSECVFVDITDIDAEEGWDYDADTGTFSEPTLTTEEQIEAVNDQYLPQFEALQQSYTAALLTGDTTSAAAIQTDYQTLLSEYNEEMGAITDDE